jgi:hypothetical protein
MLTASSLLAAALRLSRHQKTSADFHDDRFDHLQMPSDFRTSTKLRFVPAFCWNLWAGDIAAG